MTTKVKSDRWKITCFGDNYIAFSSGFLMAKPYATLRDAVLALKSELRRYLSSGIEIDIPKNSLLTALGRTIVKDDIWRISKGAYSNYPTLYIVQTRDKESTPWNSPTVKTIAAFDNIEAAMLKVIELLEIK